MNSEFIPGRKNVFIQNFETDSGIVGIPVDQVDDAEIENSCSQGNAVASQSKTTALKRDRPLGLVVPHQFRIVSRTIKPKIYVELIFVNC